MGLCIIDQWTDLCVHGLSIWRGAISQRDSEQSKHVAANMVQCYTIKHQK